MIRTDLKRHTNAFLQTLGDKSERTYAGYAEGLDALTLFFDGYYEDDSRGKTVEDIKPEDIDHILSYIVIRKFMDGERFRANSAKAIKSFFAYLVGVGAYDKTNASKIASIADHYRKQYHRIEKLEKCLWDETEGEIDAIMKLPEKQQTEAIERLKSSVKDAKLMDVGYVTIQKIDGEYVYGGFTDGSSGEIGPVKIGPASLELVQIGDVINMITLRQKKGDVFWEIAELGYVYPKQYTTAA